MRPRNRADGTQTTGIRGGAFDGTAEDDLRTGAAGMKGEDGGTGGYSAIHRGKNSARVGQWPKWDVVVALAHQPAEGTEPTGRFNEAHAAVRGRRLPNRGGTMSKH